MDYLDNLCKKKNGLQNKETPVPSKQRSPNIVVVLHHERKRTYVIRSEGLTNFGAINFSKYPFRVSMILYIFYMKGIDDRLTQYEHLFHEVPRHQFSQSRHEATSNISNPHVVKNSSNNRAAQANKDLKQDSDLPFFSLNEVVKAIRKFSADNKLRQKEVFVRYRSELTDTTVEAQQRIRQVPPSLPVEEAIEGYFQSSYRLMILGFSDTFTEPAVEVVPYFPRTFSEFNMWLAVENQMPNGEHKNVVAGTLRAHKRCPPYFPNTMKTLC
ncbi:glycosyl transferase, family 20, Trehalose-phosphatase, HAD-like domain protein [Artemisia annua]|uniref:Glycosyl transferase, family 20, Trehalose-phosphatase, HAD-like domain protein n=1 Tax=Artemisia annua TaxID=35608 RepID=A0A2U1NDJ1_ARTAN|nr:glycosyl transferase, family 20, Trehalose-phosphatase, HAD-like domain protein [Artemisia annua]